MIKLNNANMATLSAAVARPTYDRSKLKTGIVHFGVGGFHRAHQAMYLDRLMNKGEALDWGICGVGVMPSDRRMRDALNSQDGLYTLMVKHPSGKYEATVIGSIIDFLYAPDDPEAVLELMAAPSTRIVSLTITEGGYNFHHVTGEFDLGNADVVHDLAVGCRPQDGVRPSHRGTASPPRSQHRAVHGDELRQHPEQRRRCQEDVLYLRQGEGR